MKSKRINQNKTGRANSVEHASEFIPAQSDMSLDQKKNESEAILAQWQTCVEMANSISQRRDTMNNWFITLNAAIASFVPSDLSSKSFSSLIVGICLCYLWNRIIENYKVLNESKFFIINELEKKLPVRPFTQEWDIIQEKKKRRMYKDSTTFEKWLPIVFGIIYIVNFSVIVVNNLSSN